MDTVIISNEELGFSNSVDAINHCPRLLMVPWSHGPFGLKKIRDRGKTLSTAVRDLSWSLWSHGPFGLKKILLIANYSFLIFF